MRSRRRVGLGVGIVLSFVLVAGALELARAKPLMFFSLSFENCFDPCQTVSVYAENCLPGDPAIAGNGELRHQETDLLIPSLGFPMRFTRVYRLQLQYNGPMGYGWDHDYNTRVILYDGVGGKPVSLHTGTGRIEAFTAVTPGGSATPET